MGVEFLKAVVGEDGAKALSKALESSPGLAPMLVPRALVSWLTAHQEGYSGVLPGTDKNFFLAKTENGFEGFVKSDEETVVFKDVSFVEVAAGLSVILEADFQNDSLSKKELSNLGKSIDQLVFATAKKAELPGQPAPPRGQEGPVPPSPPTKQRRIPKTREGNPFLKKEFFISKEEMKTKCKKCEKSHFEKGKLVGCDCLRNLKKGEYTSTPKEEGYVFSFEGWSPVALSVLVSTFRD